MSMSAVQPVAVAIQGAGGRMGGSLLALIAADPRFALAGALVRQGSALAGQPTGLVAGEHFSTDWADAGAAQVLIDFSGPAGFESALSEAKRRGIPLVTGTTGLADAEAALAAASERIAVLQAANFSLGVALLIRLLRQAAAALPGWDLEIFEAHHGRKADAPSGTALALGEAAAQARGQSLEQLAVYQRAGRTGPRLPGAIGFAVARGGQIVGEHSAWLIGEAERIELAHRAADRSIFARGALEAAAWLLDRPPGRYDMEALLAANIAI